MTNGPVAVSRLTDQLIAQGYPVQCVWDLGNGYTVMCVAGTPSATQTAAQNYANNYVDVPTEMTPLTTLISQISLLSILQAPKLQQAINAWVLQQAPTLASQVGITGVSGTTPTP